MPTTEQQAIHNAEATYANLVQSWGIRLTPEVQNFISHAVQRGLTGAAFLQAFRTTKAYARRFPGLVAHGVPQMSESQYISGYQSAKDYAASLGRNLSPQAYGLAVKNGNSPSEIKAKLVAVDKLKAYGPQLDEFNEYLLNQGKISQPLKKDELLGFVMGQRQDLQREWQVAHTAFQMQELAGVNVGKPDDGGDVSFKELNGLIKRFVATGGDPESVDFTKMGALINEVVPKAELYGAGITKRDIVQMMLSGRKAPEIAGRVQRVLDTYKAAVTEPGAQSQNQQGQVYQGTPMRQGLGE